jgi:hypothetical protein
MTIPALVVPMYGVLILTYFAGQDSPRTLADVCNEIAFCIPDDDWDVNKTYTRSLLKLLLTHLLGVTFLSLLDSK